MATWMKMNFTLNKAKASVTSWDLAIERVSEKKVDMSISGYSITSQRAKNVDFSFPIFQQSFKLFYPLREVNARWGQYAKPFYPDTWGVILIYSVGSGLIIAGIIHFVCDTIFQPNRTAGLRTFQLLKETFLKSLSFSAISLMGRRFPIEPRTMSARMAFVTISAVGFIIISLYRAMIGAELTIIKIKHPVNSMEEVLNSDYNVAVMSGTAMEYYFDTSNSSTLKRITQNKLKKIKPESLSMGEALQQIIDEEPESLAFFEKTTPFSIHGLNCKLSSVDENYMSHGIGIAFQKNFPYTKLFNQNLLSLHENGTISRLKSYWQRKQTRCEQPKHEGSTLQHTFTLYLLLLLGIVLSYIVFVVETKL